jgi:serine/threonine protein kinase
VPERVPSSDFQTLSSSEFELVDSEAAVTLQAADSMTRVAASRASLSDTLVGSYRLRRLIGEGGMSAVYEAEHVDLGRIVAVKVLQRERAADRRAVSRLAHEARVVAGVNHPNVCGVHDLGTLADGRPYIVMDRLQGGTLASRILRDGAVEARDIVPIIVQLLSALAAVHEIGVIHRDLKPQNVFLTPRADGAPWVKLLDFGLSRGGTGDATPILGPGFVVGTPIYMAPEQISGKRLDRRVDIWASGVILYEALSGRPPFWSAKFSAIVHQVTRSRHRPLDDVDPSIPLELVTIVNRALAKDPADRFSSAIEFRDALVAMSWARETALAFSEHPSALSSSLPSAASPPEHVPRGPSGLPYLGDNDSTETSVVRTDEPGTQVFPLVKRTRRSKDGGPPRRSPIDPRRN